ncbi:META domain-containing protein [Confluentibacter sediminis]|uniref:META domain-containing protein n=1 Tax=Confluentibacter sediminis TaxID=2219045 RepID=UPI000DAEB69D|nr:META domain-containing protein [Confluentibacter sediminis]
MKQLKLFCLFTVILMLNACKSTKTMGNTLYNTTWELEYITGPRIAFNGLYPDKKPQITFNKTTNKVEGHSSCNGYSADFSIHGNSITFGEPGPTTMMYCGQGEQVFLNTIKKVNTYSLDEEGKLILILDDVAMMRFKKVN